MNCVTKIYLYCAVKKIIIHLEGKNVELVAQMDTRLWFSDCVKCSKKCCRKKWLFFFGNYEVFVLLKYIPLMLIIEWRPWHFAVIERSDEVFILCCNQCLK